MTTVQVGRQAEAVAAAYLQQHGYQILAQNWRTRSCEIDLVAREQSTIYFVEVKYRRSAGHGAGLDYITPTKLRRMTFAGQLWVKQHGWQGWWELSALEVTGRNFEPTNFVPTLT